MTRLTKPELARHRIWLSEWRTPVDMASYVYDVNDVMGSADFLGQAGVEFLRDAWLAAEFGRHRQSTFVRLVSERERWPDFETQAADGTESVECAEVDLPGRRRSDEYRNAHKSNTDGKVVKDDPVGDPTAHAKQVETALSAVIAGKLAKHYASHASLLLYLNVGRFGIQQARLENTAVSAFASALPCFKQVWVLWQTELHGPWAAR